ncbi:MAG: M23 family metallopeptidase [Aquificaceae bacterium]
MKYRYRLEERRERRLGFLRLVRRLAVLALFFIALYLLFLSLGLRPQLSEESLKELSLIPFEKTYHLKLSRPIKEIRLYVEEEGQKKEIYKAVFSKPQQEFSFRLRARDVGLKDGEVDLLLELSSGLFRNRAYHLKALVDTVPPKLDVISYTPYPSLGGTFAIKVRVGEEAQVYMVQGGQRYDLYPMGEGYYFGLFPVRLDKEEASIITLNATDKVGNSTSKVLRLNIRQVRFKEDRISVDDSFISNVIYPLLGEEGKDLTPLEAFKRVNEVWRSMDVKKVEDIGKRSEPRALWEGAFLQLPNSKVFATYGDIRHYYYKGQKISESRHMGFDFASVERAPVPASNSGVVVFTGSLGIYGNTIIIDHGMGLMSIYGHLSEISVKEGQFVKKGEIIGRTGNSGFALGDHLHFGIVVQGYEVNPIEWLDPKWVKNNIQAVLEAR